MNNVNCLQRNFSDFSWNDRQDVDGWWFSVEPLQPLLKSGVFSASLKISGNLPRFIDSSKNREMYSKKISTFSFNILTGISVPWVLPWLMNARNSLPRSFFKKMSFKILQKSQENTCVKVYFLINLQVTPTTLLKKRLWHRRFLVNYGKIFKNAVFTEHFWENTSGLSNFLVFLRMSFVLIQEKWKCDSLFEFIIAIMLGWFLYLTTA